MTIVMMITNDRMSRRGTGTNVGDSLEFLFFVALVILAEFGTLSMNDMQNSDPWPVMKQINSNPNKSKTLVSEQILCR